MNCCLKCHANKQSYIGCHNDCQKYLKEKEERLEQLKKIHEDNFINNTIRGLYIHRKNTKR